MKKIIAYLLLGLIMVQISIFSYALVHYINETLTVYLVVMIAMCIAVIGTVMMLVDGIKRGILRLK